MTDPKTQNIHNIHNIQNIVYEYWDSEKTIKKSIKYYNASGQLHRPWQEGPAAIVYYHKPDSRIRERNYYENGKIHRPWREGPAIIAYLNIPDTSIEREYYFENDKQIYPK